MGRQHVFLNRWKELSGVENNMWFDGEKAAFHSRRNLLFKLHRDVSNPPASPNRQSLSRSCKTNTRPQQFHESAIGQHLLDNAQCALHYSNKKFSILPRGRSSLHLFALEATFIKSLNPLLCKQKEFVYSLKIS